MPPTPCVAAAPPRSTSPGAEPRARAVVPLCVPGGLHAARPCDRAPAHRLRAGDALRALLVQHRIGHPAQQPRRGLRARSRGEYLRLAVRRVVPEPSLRATRSPLRLLDRGVGHAVDVQRRAAYTPFDGSCPSRDSLAQGVHAVPRSAARSRLRCRCGTHTGASVGALATCETRGWCLASPYFRRAMGIGDLPLLQLPQDILHHLACPVDPCAAVDQHRLWSLMVRLEDRRQVVYLDRRRLVI